MYNTFEALRDPAIAATLPHLRSFEVGELLFAQVTCPPSDEWEASWSQFDHLVHVVAGRKTLRNAGRSWVIGSGDTFFVKKGAHYLREELDDAVCVLMFFIPDAFVRDALKEMPVDLPPLSAGVDPLEIAIRVNGDVALKSFLQSMLVFFADDETPAELVLKLKLKELISSLIVSSSNPALSAYLRTLARGDAPSLPVIMEANWFHNLAIEDYAKLCHRSLSSFKREFQQHYGTSPGRWLLERRLERSAQLLATTSMTVTAVVFECGFQQPSHFSRAFRAKYDRSPSAYRAAHQAAHASATEKRFEPLS
jgi:AraC family transcriptional regulator, exoenzyme S synthesis regulatory protein ExsA